MKWVDIAAMPQSVAEVPQGYRGIHESCLRSYQLLEKVKDYLRRGVPADVLLELIAETEEPKGGDAS